MYDNELVGFDIDDVDGWDDVIEEEDDNDPYTIEGYEDEEDVLL